MASFDHSSPSTVGGEFRRVSFDLDVSEDWPPVSGETLWCRDAGNGQWVVDNIPFFVRGVSLGDVVEAVPDGDGPLNFVRPVRSGGHSTLRVIVLNDRLADALAALEALGCATEVSPWPKLFAVDVAPDASYQRVLSLLEAGFADEWWEYEAAHVVHASGAE